MEDKYLWPYPNEFNGYLTEDCSVNQLKSEIEKIEIHFERKFSCNTVLMPSGRSCLSAIFKIKNVKRGELIFAPKWSSHCVWDTISRFGTPTCNFYDSPNIVINVNKWGYRFDLEKEYPLTIQDSVDSIILSPSSLFQSDSDFEILSLPKIYSTFFGGIILCNKKPDYKKLKKLQFTNMDLAQYQVSQKLKDHCDTSNFITTEKYSNWEFNEWQNFSVDLNCTTNIINGLRNEKEIEKKIKKRWDYIEDIKDLVLLTDLSDRLPIHALIPINKIKPKNLQLLKRAFNYSFKTESEKFNKFYLLPTHLGIPFNEFQYIVDNIKNCLKK